MPGNKGETDLSHQAIAKINVSVNHSPSTFSAKTVTLNDIYPLYFR